MYTPVAQRTGATATKTGYVPVAQRKPVVNPKHELYKLEDGRVVTKEQLIQDINLNVSKPLEFSRAKALGGIVDKVADVGVKAGQALLGGGATIGATLMSPLLNKGKVPKEMRVGGLGEGLFGGPVKTVPGLYEEAKSVLPEKKYGKLGSTIIAGAASLAPTLDLTGFGGSKKVLQVALKETKIAAEAARILRKVGVVDDLVEDYAKVFAKAKTAQEVQKGMDALENVLKTTKRYTPVAERAGTPKAPITLKTAPTEAIIPKATTILEPLAQEARKYKSAEEFAQGLKPSDYRKILNETGYKDERLKQPAGFGNKKRNYGDYLFAEDREIFNQMFSDFKKGEDSLGNELSDFYNQATKEPATILPIKIKDYIDQNLPDRFRGRIFGLLPENLQKEATDWFKINAPEYIPKSGKIEPQMILHEVTDAMETVAKEKGFKLPSLSPKGELTSREYELADYVRKGGTYKDFQLASTKAEAKAKGLPELPKLPKEAKMALKEATNINIPTPPSGIKKSVRGLVNPPERQITKAEDVLLRDRIRAEARGAKAGAAEARKLTRQELITKFKDSQSKIAQLRQGVMDYVKAKLPKEAQSKFLGALQEDLTRRRAFSLLERADKIAQDIAKSKEISAIKELKLPAKGAPNIAVDYQKKITEVFLGIDVAKPTEATIKRLKSLSEYLDKNKEALNLNPELLTKVKRLSQKPLRDMTLEEVKEVRETLEHLENLGKLKLALKNKYDVRVAEVNRQKLIASTKNTDPKIKDPNNLTKFERVQIEAKNGYTNTLQTPRVADMLDGFQGYKGENAKLSKRIIRAETNARDISTGVNNKFLEELKTRGINEVSEESQINIAIDLMAKQGARDQVAQLLKTHNLKEIPKLTPEEQFIADKMREYAGMHTQEIAAVAEEVKRVPFQKVDDYFPIKYERDFNIAPEDLINQQRHRTTKTPQGFTETRLPGVEKTPRVDIFGVLEEAINEQQWFINLQPELDDIKYLVLHPDYQVAAGDFGTKFWKDYLDVVSRRGWSAIASNNQFLRERRMNINNAILGYKVSTIVMQPFAVFDAMSYAATRFGPKAALDVAYEMSKSWVVPGVSKRALAESAALRMRAGGEVAIAENLERTKKGAGFYNTLKQNAMKLIQYTDQKTAAGVQNGFEKILQSLGEPNWKEEAEFLMQITQGSAEVSIRPLILSKGEGARTWFTFQTFFLNRWGIVAHDLIRSGLFASKEGKQKLNALTGLGILMAGGLAEEWTRKQIFELTRGEEPTDNTSALADAALFIPEQVPYFGGVLSSAVDFGDASGSPPIIRVFEDAISGGKQAVTGKDMKSKLRGGIRLGRSIAASEFGIPGTYQIAEFANRFLQDGKKQTTDKLLPALPKLPQLPTLPKLPKYEY